MSYRQIDYPNYILPCGESIAQVGCKISTYSDIRAWMGKPITPPSMADLLIAKGEMVGCAIAHYDSLERCFPDELALAAVKFFDGPADLSLVDNTPDDIYVELWIQWPNGLISDNPHFLPVYSYVAGQPASTLKVVDSYDGAIKALAAYGDPATIICGIYRHRVLVPAPPPPPGPTHVPVTFPTTADGSVQSAGEAALDLHVPEGPPSPPGGWDNFRAWVRRIVDWIMGRGA